MKPFFIRACIAAVAVSVLPMVAWAADLSAGGYHVARVDDGLVLGLGDGTYGQLGANPAGGPATVAGLSNITQVAAGGFSTLALKSDGTVWFLGETTLQYTTPHGTPAPVTTPQQVTGLAGIDAIAAGHRHYLALDTDSGNLYAWGHNGSGQVGSGGLQDVVTPAVVLTDVATMSAGDGFSLAVKTNQTLWAWGRNHHGQLGLGDTADHLNPTQVPGVTHANSVAAGGQHTLVLLTNGTVVAAGNNDFGQLGLGSVASTSTFATVSGLTDITEVTAGYSHCAALDTGAQVLTWGRNFEGQCGGGSGSAVTYSTPQVLLGLSGTPTGIDCGYHFTLVALADGSVSGLGSNSDGQLDGVSVADQDNSRKVLEPQSVPLASDETPPTPGTMAFSAAPAPTGARAITMTAVAASDPSGVEYFFDCTTAGSNDSEWQDSRTYTDTGLVPGIEYTYRVQARDKSTNRNATVFSDPASATAVATGAIALDNYSFEADENTDAAGAFAQGARASFGGQLTAWISQSGTDGRVSVGWKSITATELDPDPPVGGQESQALSLQTGSSVLNTNTMPWSSLSVGDRLTLTISLGMRDASANINWCEGTFFGLTDGDADFATVELADTVTHSGVIANNPATGTQAGDGTFTDVSFTYTVQAGDLARSGDIGILIYAEGSGGSGAANQSFFDHVRLTNDTVSVATSPTFVVAAEAGSGVAATNELVGLLQVTAGDASEVVYSIVEGRSDLFAIANGNRLVKLAGVDPGPVGTTHTITIEATNAVASRRLNVIIEVTGTPCRGTVLILR